MAFTGVAREQGRQTQLVTQLDDVVFVEPAEPRLVRHDRGHIVLGGDAAQHDRTDLPVG
jgi:hypothetical protein